MVRIGYARLGDIGAIAGLTGELEGRDPRNVALHREHLEIEHQARMVGIRSRYAQRPVQIGREIVFRDIRLRLLDAALHLTHRVEVLGDLGPISRPKIPPQARDVLGDPIEQTRPFAQRRLALGQRAAFAEEPFKHDARVRLRGQRRRRRGPREIVLVDAGVAVVALAGRLQHIHRELEGRELGRVPDLLRRDLVGGRAEIVVGAFGVLRLGRAQKGRVRGRVGAGVGRAQLEVCDRRDVALHAFERLQNR